MSHKVRFYLIILLYLLANISFASDNGFDEICRIYTEAQNSNMNKTQLSNYIWDNIQHRVKNNDALKAHEAVFQLDPTKRYPIFKKSAEISLKKKWNCAAVKELLK